MRLTAVILWLKIVNFFRGWGYCDKELQGYSCRHSIHNGIRECDGSRV